MEQGEHTGMDDRAAGTEGTEDQQLTEAMAANVASADVAVIASSATIENFIEQVGCKAKTDWRDVALPSGSEHNRPDRLWIYCPWVTTSDTS